jgi:hypothetical protein
MAIRFRVWRRGGDVWLRMEKPDGEAFTVRLDYNEAERLRHKVGKVMERVIKEMRRVDN